MVAGSRGACAAEYEYEAPPSRDRLPTIPRDLTSFAWIHTGPPSRLYEEMVRVGAIRDDLRQMSRITDVAELFEPAREAREDLTSEIIDLSDDDVTLDDDSSDPWFRPSEVDDMTTGMLIDLWHSDVPRVVTYVTTVIDVREARLLSMMDGTITVGALLESSGLPIADVLDMLCDLTARNVVQLDRSRRHAPPVSGITPTHTSDVPCEAAAG